MTTDGYEASRLNALSHGLTARSLVLPWEDPAELEVLLADLVAEHRPQGPTERHLVEQIAAVFWRHQRVLLAEGAAIRSSLDSQLRWDSGDAAREALAHLGDQAPDLDAADALDSEDVAAEVEVLNAVEGKARKGLELLRREDEGIYGRALKVVHEDTRSWWEDRLEDGEADTQGRHLLPDAASLARFLEEEALPWIGRRRQELLHRPLIRSQLLGKVLPAHQLEKLARYEVHLDRKLQRLLGMLFKLQEVRRTLADVTE